MTLHLFLLVLRNISLILSCVKHRICCKYRKYKSCYLKKTMLMTSLWRFNCLIPLQSVFLIDSDHVNFCWDISYVYSHFRRSTEIFCEKRCSLKLRKFHRKLLVPESLSSKGTILRERLLHRCCPVNLMKFSRNLL